MSKVEEVMCSILFGRLLMQYAEYNFERDDNLVSCLDLQV